MEFWYEWIIDVIKEELTFGSEEASKVRPPFFFGVCGRGSEQDETYDVLTSRLLA